jgi:D-aminopeptidase
MHFLVTLALVLAAVAPARPRARDIGLVVGTLPPGPLNAITDVAGVKVGHTSVIRGENVRTGVTVILPHERNLFREKVTGAVFVGNGFGKLMGSTQIEELGEIESPIALTSTLNVARVADALIDHMLALPGNEDVRSINVVVGETNDGQLNDIRSRPVGRDDVFAAIKNAKDGPVDEGSVGAGTGTIAFGWKGGIGTSSRVLPGRAGGYTLGVLVQTNFGGNLTIDGVPVWKSLGRAAFMPPPAINRSYAARETSSPGHGGIVEPRRARDGEATADGSCMIVIATDAPLTARDLQRIAARGVFALARTGSSYSHGSGDFAIAFSTSPEARTRFNERARRARTLLPAEAVSPLFQAALEATEEAVYNSLFRATTMTGNGRTIEALPIDRVKALLASRPATP